MPPNIVLIVVDDLGWRDVGCYGSPFYETPVVDRLARDGTRFTYGYAASPVCSPTRASIMSGKYPANVGVTNWIGGEERGRVLPPEYLHGLPSGEISLAQALSEAGYATWHLGKWHLGGEEHYPEEHGFDVNVGGCDWGSPGNGYFSPWNIPTLENGPDGEYLTDRLGDEAVALVEDHAAEDGPFFMNLNFYSVHTPIQGKDEHVAKYERKRRALGLDDVQEFERGGRFPCEHKKDEHIERRVIQSDPVYAGMVQSVDENVGKVVDALSAAGELEDTVVVFTSDNGGLATAEGSPTCNSPLSEGKGWMYEGGTRVPFIVRWPGMTDADEICTEPVTSPDVYPTLLEAAGTDVPDGQSVDGVSLVPLLEGGDLDRESIYFHYPHYGNQGGTPYGAVRAGDWKLIEFYEDDHLELYNLRDDVGEENDLSDEKARFAADLREQLADWREAVGASTPEPNPDFEPWGAERP